ncbi:MAG: MazG nucleotide pyrophosphohydrolase domain-containing protein [bacterium]|nr:MazG nucleotide pyrophosphohydrolase domain-containing protein [bacterium]
MSYSQDNPSILSLAVKIQEKARRVGFDWKDIEDVFQKLIEEIDEFKRVYRTDNKEKIEEELGDILFSIVNIARFLQIDPESSLKRTINKFINRFSQIEKEARLLGRRVEDFTLDEMDAIWERCKKF